MDINRRRFLTGLTGLSGFLTAPLLTGVRASRLASDHDSLLERLYRAGWPHDAAHGQAIQCAKPRCQRPDAARRLVYAVQQTLCGRIGRARAGSVCRAYQRDVRFAQAKFLSAIDDLVAGSNGLDVSDLDPNVWQGTEVGGKHYALPLDVHVLGMYYNKRMFREAGVVDARGEARPPQTDRSPGRLRTPDAPQCRRRGTVGLFFTNLESNFYNLMRQWDGPFFTPDESRCLLSDPRNVAALEFGMELVRQRRVAPPPENFDSWVGFRQGKVGMAWEGVYMLGDLVKQTDLDFGGAPVPQLGTRPAVWANSHNLCLRADMPDAQRQAAWRFVKFLSDNSLDWAAGGQVPIRKSLRATPRFQSMTVQAAFASQVPLVVYPPRLPFIFEFLTEYDQAVEHALRGSLSAQAAMNTATTNVNAIIARRQEGLRATRT